MLCGLQRAFKSKSGRDGDKETEEEDDDRISELPDPILHHILSFIGTKIAVSTSVLSKRWRYVATSIPTLDFREYHNTPKSTKKVIDFINNRLMGMNNHEKPIIEKFCLYCNIYLDSVQVYSWLDNIILQNKIQELILHLHDIHCEQFVLQPSLFTCRSLTVFKLKGCSYFPTSICSQSLKIISLEIVTFSGAYPTDHLLFNCPVLKELNLDNCILKKNMKTVRIVAPLLKCFTAIWFYRFDNCEINIEAPHLNKIIFEGYVPHEFKLWNFPSLSYACIDRIHREDISKVFFGNESRLAEFPSFNNLAYLELRGKGEGCPLRKRTLLNLLLMSPKLETLVISAKDFRRDLFPKVRTVRHGLPLHFKFVEIKDIDDNKSDHDIVEFFLKNAGILERMIITHSSYISTDIKKKITTDLLKILKCSRECHIKFIVNE